MKVAETSFLADAKDAVSKKKTPKPVVVSPELHSALRQHAVIAPSKLHIIQECLATLLPTSVPERPSYAAEEGTLAHELLEYTLKGNDPDTFDLKSEGFEEAKRHTSDLKNIIDQIVEKIGADCIQKKLIEVKVHWSEHIFGTADFALLYVNKGKKKIYIIDFKYGKGLAVHVYNDETKKLNPQIMAYAAAVAAQYAWTPDEVILAIYQPRNFEISDEAFDWHRISGKELRKFEKDLEKLEKKALLVLQGKTKPKEVPGEHCRFCPRKLECMGYKSYATAGGLLLLDDLTPAIVTPETTNGTAPAKTELPAVKIDTLPDNVIVNIINSADAFHAFVNEVKRFALHRALSGHPIEGTKLIRKRSQRKWNLDADADETMIGEALKELGVIKPYTRKLKTITEIERELGKGAVASLTVKPEGRLACVRLSHKSPAVEPPSNGAELLTEIDEAEEDE